MSPEAQADLRYRAVEAVLAGGRQVDVAQTLGLRKQVVNRWVVAYREKGEAVFEAGRRGRKEGAGRKLEPWQMGQIAQAIRDKAPDQLKLPFYLWTREAVVERVGRRYGVTISVWTAGRYLKRWGFTPQKPAPRAMEQNPEAVRRWLEETYPKVRARAPAEGARILWEDEMGIRSDPAAGRSFSPRGKTPRPLRTGQRFGCTMISAISNRGKLYFQVFTGSFNSQVFIGFLRRLVRQMEGSKVFLIVDGHSAHRSRASREWVAAHAEQIELFFLPPYSPELNPDEFLNQDVKSNAVGRKRAITLPELMQHVRGYLRSRQRSRHIVQHAFHAPTVKYAA